MPWVLINVVPVSSIRCTGSVEENWRAAWLRNFK